MDRIKQTINAYDRNAEIYDKFSLLKHNQFEINFFISKLRGKKILDAGCGSGRDYEQLMEYKLDITGIDLSKELIIIAKNRTKKRKFKIMDIRYLNFRERFFSGVWCNEALIHIPKKETLSVLKEFKRVLKPRGIIYVSIIIGTGEQMKKDKEVNRSPRFFAFYTQDEFEKLLMENDFEIISSQITDNVLHIFFKPEK